MWLDQFPLYEGERQESLLPFPASAVSIKPATYRLLGRLLAGTRQAASLSGSFDRFSLIFQTPFSLLR